MGKTGKDRKKRESRWSAWLREDLSPVTLCDGAVITSDVYEIKENRYRTLILKGLIVYFLTAGGMGSYLTALEISFNQLIFNLVIFVTAILCAVLYHSWRSENLGYLGFFSVYAATLFLFRDYINSGFYAVVNDTIEWASTFFDTEGMQYYSERISNRYAAVTISMTLIGIALNILLNNYILRRARYMVAVFLTVTLNLIAFYMQREPDAVYMIMLIAGLIMTYVLKSGRHYWLSRNDRIFEKTKKGLSYKLDSRSLLQSMILVLAVTLIGYSCVSLFESKDDYDTSQVENEQKTVTRETVSNFIMLGVVGLINYYPNNGGLDSGQLGGVSSIRLDYQPDLSVELTPYTAGRIYIKNFIGETYVPYENIWTQPKDFVKASAQNEREAAALKKDYEEKKTGTAQGRMVIQNIEAAPLPYLPYYTEEEHGILPRGREETVVYYPRLQDSGTFVPGYTPAPGYLDTPEENREAVRQLIQEAGLSRESSPEENIQKLEDYYQANIPYTIRPGATPWRSDFINYFITKNRKGYCAHFASAATLVFRELGIPARYCEGYAIDFSQITSQGELVEGADYDDYYQGDSDLGRTALVKVNATDADAHAWVEVYLQGQGWTVVDVTPSSSETEEDDQSFWDSFNNIFGDGGNDRSADAPDLSQAGRKVSDGVMKGISLAVIAAAVLAVLIFGGRKIVPWVVYRKNYRKANRSDQLILWYAWTVNRRRRKDREFRKRKNYREQTEYLAEKAGTADSAMTERLIRILEEAGFSSREISAEDFQFARETEEALLNPKKSSESKRQG